MDAIIKQLCNGLGNARLPTPCATWTRAFLAAQRVTSPPHSNQLKPLLETARTAILAGDLTSANFLDASTCHALPPASAFAPEVCDGTLPRDVVVQVLDIEDVSRSRWDQIEELEAAERGELTKGREIIRAPVEDDDETTSTAPQTKIRRNATHRLVVQDFKGFQAFALELSRIEALGVGRTTIGAKLLINAGAPIARGSILLEPANCVVLGGGVASWHSKWLEEKKKRLKEMVSPAQNNKK